jgi:hypothetical protein
LSINNYQQTTNKQNQMHITQHWQNKTPQLPVKKMLFIIWKINQFKSILARQTEIISQQNNY